MKIMDKIKNIFTDEVEEEVKTGMIQVEIPAPTKIESAKEDHITDNDTIKAEEKPATPIFFDDDYFKELEQPKQEVKSNYKKEKIVPTEKKIFKPTPIISPVYGVLDKNYHKDEITSKKTTIKRSEESISIDDIRKKAFGTLEDELETTLFGVNSLLFREEIENKEETDLFEDLTNEDTIDLELNDTYSEDINKDNMILDELEKEDSIDENDLFDLIDSMYEEGDKK